MNPKEWKSHRNKELKTARVLRNRLEFYVRNLDRMRSEIKPGESVESAAVLDGVLSDLNGILKEE